MLGLCQYVNYLNQSAIYEKLKYKFLNNVLQKNQLTHVSHRLAVQTRSVNNVIMSARVFASTITTEIRTKAVNQNAFSVQIVQRTKPAFKTNVKIRVQEYVVSRLSVPSSITFLLALVNQAT